MVDVKQDIERGLKEAQIALTRSDFARAAQLTDEVLATSPDHIDALYIAAVAARYQKHYETASRQLEKLKQLSPEFGRAFQEEGHLALAMGQDARALIAYQRACEFNPALEASWRALAGILKKRNDPEQNAAQAQAERLKNLPRELVAVTGHLFEGKLLKAEQICRHFLHTNPHHPEAMRLLADIAQKYGVLDQAEFLLDSLLTFEPDNVQARFDYINVLRRRSKYEDARKQAKTLYDKDPENPLFQSHYAVEALQTGDYEVALSVFDDILERLPNDHSTLTSRGHALKTVGRQKEAIASYQAAFRSKPDHGDAYYSLANLKTYRFTDDEIGDMLAMLDDQDLSHQNRIYLCFSLGKGFEDRGEFARSFEFYERGNALKKVQCRYDADQMDEELDAQRNICNADLFEQHTGHGDPAPDPIFIVGLPRAGSTLLEQILSSHRQVDGTLELPNILTLSHRLRGGKRVSAETGYPKNLFDMTEEKCAEFGAQFLSETQIHRKGAPYFIDKMPNNFRHIALIRLILPNAKIIDARRHPLSCCFSGFKQLFAEGQEFTYGLEEVGRYYRGYEALMEHWSNVQPGKILRVQYEDVIADTEAQVRRLLEFCNLPFEQSCVEFYKTDRAVRTASSEQVRQPINTQGLDQWRKFESFLAPLREALGEDLLARYAQYE